ncbi:ComEC/Rec2 family competence protein [Pseudoalteromonas xiamenensis]|uniref:ComEC/Rec2 family competence protein n=1 Tax=Pseudoalteromonas xiamenensis TaxID=882626 RepID=UPI0035E939D7
MTGDSFVITWQGNCVLIDGGMPNTYGEIQRKLQGNHLKALFVTHVDYDHIGGVINLIKQPSVDITNCTFFMNNPELASNYNDTKVRYEHGDTLQKMLQQRGKYFLPITKSTAPIEIEGLKIIPILPTQELCQQLCDNWDLSRVWDELKGSYDYLKSQKNNGDIINKASVCLIIEYQQRKVLFLGDSHADDVKEALSELKEFKFDLVKLSHHGSKHNTSSGLLEIVDCNDYIISTNSGKYEHPDPETVRLLSNRAKQSGCEFNIYLNYPIEELIRQRYKEKYREEIENLNFILQLDVEL